MYIKNLLAMVLLSLSSWVLAAPDFLVDAEWLGEHIDEGNLRILEVRYHPHRYYTVGHIKGAVQVQRFKDLGDNNRHPLMHFPTQAAFQATLRGWGINDDSQILLYDDSRTALTSRLYFLLELYGFNMNQVKILNGGTLEWSIFEELSQEKASYAAGNVSLKPANQDLVIEWTDVYDDVVSRRDDKVVLVDARPEAMYVGDEIKHAIAAGHIPGAINIVSLDGTDAQSQTWLADEAIAAMYEDIDKDKTIYLYCHDGFRMGLAYLQLKSLGYQQVKLYDGGWTHWGNRLTLPVIKGNKPYSNDYDL